MGPCAAYFKTLDGTKQLRELRVPVIAAVEVWLLFDEKRPKRREQACPLSLADSSMHCAMKSTVLAGIFLVCGCTEGTAIFPAVFDCSCTGTEGRSTSTYMNLSQALMNGLGVLDSPIPNTILPDSRNRKASGVKSLSLDTMTKPSTTSSWRMSIASIINATSVAFFPVV